MNTRRSNGFKALAMLLAFALVQISLQVTIAASVAPSFPTLQPQGVMGRVTTRGTAPITINGNNAVSGDSIATGAILQTPGGTEATIDLGPLGTIEMSSNTRIQVDYSCPPEAIANPTPELCRVTIKVLAGCVVANYRKGTHYEVYNDKQARIAQSDADKERSEGGTLRTCFDAAPAGAAATTGGLGQTGVIAIIAAAAVIPPVVIIAAGGDDPSPGAP